MNTIQMVDLHGQYLKLKKEIDAAIQEVITSSSFINGPAVQLFSKDLAAYTGTSHVIPCGNGTDALQVALMALNLSPGDEVIVPDFTFIASIEVIAFLGLTPVIIDVNPGTFLMEPDQVEKAITSRTRAVLPVHLFGQSVQMEPLMQIAQQHHLFVIEDAAQSLGCNYTFSDGVQKKSGTIGHIGCTSFFPSKSLGAYGDGGAIFTDDPELAQRMKSLVNHGTHKKYFHERVGINSRLDSIQAAILDVKLKYLDSFNHARQRAADFYDKNLESVPFVNTPERVSWSDHIFHQYTLVTHGINRNKLMEFLRKEGISSMVYYPQPMHKQQAFHAFSFAQRTYPVTEHLCEAVLSLPMHPELTDDQLSKITNTISTFTNA